MILAGLVRLGADAEVRYTTSGDPVANLSLAYNYGRKGDDGKRQTQWIFASLWGDSATALAPYLTKGAALSVVIEDPHIETYERRDGGAGHKITGRITLLEFAGGKEREDRESMPVAPTPQRPAADKPPAEDFSDSDDYPF